MSIAHESSESDPSNDKREKFARFGIGTIGAVYILVGGLTAWSTLGGDGQEMGRRGTMEYLRGQPFGQILLWIIVIGLLGYVFWRMYQAFADPEGKKSDGKRLVSRVCYFCSGAFYCFLIYSTVSILLGTGSSDDGKSFFIQTLLEQEYGRWLVVAVALIFLGYAIYQMYYAYSGKFKDKLDETNNSERTRKVIFYTGHIGYTARGVVIGIIAFLITKAAITYDSSEAGGTKDAFSFVQDEFGTVALSIVALGLAVYGVFMLMKASQREINF